MLAKMTQKWRQRQGRRPKRRQNGTGIKAANQNFGTSSIKSGENL